MTCFPQIRKQLILPEIDFSNYEISIYVEDTGKGIPKEEQRMIFERFYKQDEFVQGTGLGLSISMVIAEKLGGKISVSSEAGKGSRFTFTLHLASGNRPLDAGAFYRKD